MPDFFACPRVNLHQIVVVRLHEQVIPPHADASMSCVRPTARLPVEPPEYCPVACVDGPEVVGRRRIQDAVDHEDRSADSRRAAAVELACGFAGNCERHVSTAAAASAAKASAAGAACPSPGWARALDEAALHPRQPETLHRCLVDLRE